MCKAEMSVLLNWKPDAYSVYYSGDCPNCGCSTEFTCLLPSIDRMHPDEDKEYCLYVCLSDCGWAKYGTRVKLDKGNKLH